MNLGEAAALAGWASGRFLARPNLTNTFDLSMALTELGIAGVRALTVLRRRNVITRGTQSKAGHWVDALNVESLLRAACGSLSPAQSWARSWDGKWRVLCFDIPARPASRRQKLSRFLHQNKFGLLQRSVWISPDPQEQLLQQFRPEANAHSLLLWEAPTPKGITPGTFAQLAWDFESINQSYQKVLNHKAGNLSPNEHLLEITRLWHLAVAQDPLLPRSACPKNYLGFEATAAVEKLWQGFQPARKTPG